MSVEGYLPQDEHFATRVVHSGLDETCIPHGAIVPPITLSSTYRMKPGGEWDEFVYSRLGSPSRLIIEKAIAKLEDGKYGLAFSAGLSAVKAATMLLSAGDHIVVSDDVYGGSTTLWRHHTERTGIVFSYVDARNASLIESAITPQTKMVYLETPSNPTMKIADLEAVVAVCRRHPGIITVCDNTFMSPYFQRPLNFGIDIVIESITKYLNGHSDVVMGAVATNREDLYERLKLIQIDSGMVPGPFDCYLAFRGMRTLHVRMPHHMRGALHVAKFLEDHPHVERVLYPGLESHPQHELVKRQAYGCSGMLSFYIRGGRPEAMEFFRQLKLFTMAGSLGGYESLAVGPTFSTHVRNSKEELDSLNITGAMVRLSIGLESPSDLCTDLDQALRAACAERSEGGGSTGAAAGDGGSAGVAE
ncbi:cystathionine gamma-lyase-like [Amphibalanus amphitrite]|uniref:cystathionine gamma-lyase-like n=1 Tax=Amphibalanus amphitrite TaxID=1232801 RepID=UPI001C90F0A8|nr:cystathionine gamma-lyase-like [Amphibalanus amphitrite]